MRQARVLVHGVEAGILEELAKEHYRFTYHVNYSGPPVSLTMPTKQQAYDFHQFPPFFEGLLPEGIMLEALLRLHKLNRNDYFGQLLKVGRDVVGAVTVEDII
jgi:serine/threonine-protein kinase HipA